MRIISWNVNGIRAAIRKGFLDFLAEQNPDIICLQEVKAEPQQVELELPQYKQFWNPAQKKGYSGTAIFCKPKVIEVCNGLGIEKHDQEGRVITLEFPKAFLVNVYTPNSKHELLRLDYRTKEWDVDFLEYCKGLEKTKPVIFCGDLNVAHKEIDLARPKNNTKNPGFTPEERVSFDNIVESGFIDTFREFEKEGGHYSWWSYRANARANNVGWRIDYFCVSSVLKKKLKGAGIMPEVDGSDHCPVFIDIDL